MDKNNNLMAALAAGAFCALGYFVGGPIGLLGAAVIVCMKS